MTREDSKKLFRNDLDSYGKPKKIMTKIDIIYDDFKKDCSVCKFNGDDNGESWQEGYNEAYLNFKNNKWLSMTRGEAINKLATTNLIFEDVACLIDEIYTCFEMKTISKKDKIVNSLMEIREFADINIHPLDDYNIYCQLIDFIDNSINIVEESMPKKIDFYELCKPKKKNKEQKDV